MENQIKSYQELKQSSLFNMDGIMIMQGKFLTLY